MRDAFRVAVLSLAVAACDGAVEDTGLVLVVRSDLRPPGEINRVELSVAHDGAHQHEGVELGSGALAFPVRFGIAVPRSSEKPIVVHVNGIFVDGNGAKREVVTRAINIDPLPGERRRVAVELNRSCMKAHCPSGTTCIPGRGCVSPRIELDDRLPDRAGPVCDCKHFFPMCVGARWKYHVRRANGETYTKTWVISDYGYIADRSGSTMEDAAQGKQEVEAFLQIREAGIDRSRRWVARQGTEIQWHRSEWLDALWERNVLRYDVPRRLRLDEGKTKIGERWTADYKQVEFGPPYHRAKEVNVPDEWEVVDPATVQGIAAEFRGRELLCQSRIEATTTPVVAVYCFARGIGKVYERTEGVEEETLLEANTFCRVYP